MSTDVEMFSETDYLNYGKEIMNVLKQHSLIRPGEEESLRKDLYL